MGCIFQTLKIVIIILILVNIGTGYTKFYQLLVDFVDKVGEIDGIKSFEDLIWIPFLIVQVSSTIFQFVQLYCLFRELCENNFMYKHCFKCCFVLTVLIYVFSVLPKSVLTIIYYNYSSSITKWWKSVADFFDSLLSGVSALGFQIILFMPVILRTLRSAGMCRKQGGPIGTKSDVADNDLDLEKDNSDKSKCCFMICCKSSRQNSTEKENTTGNEIKNDKSNTALRKMTKTVKHTANKGIKIKSSLETRKKVLETKAINIKVKQMNKLEQKVEDRKLRIKSKFTKQPDEHEKGSRDVDGDDDGPEKETEKKNALMVCLTTCKSKMCICLENRTRCFIISMALANFHLLVYVVELVFIFCFIC